MNFYSDETYGESVAGVYDEWYSEYDSNAIDALAELAHGGRALELGIGTGRIALPLSAGAEYRIGSALGACKLFAVLALTLAYYQNAAKEKTELKFGPVPGIAVGCGRIHVNGSAVLSSHAPLAAVVGSMTLLF